MLLLQIAEECMEDDRKHCIAILDKLYKHFIHKFGVIFYLKLIEVLEELKRDHSMADIMLTSLPSIKEKLFNYLKLFI